MPDENARMRLGRGLAALIGDADVRAATAHAGEKPSTGDRNVPIEQIRANPANPRQRFEEEELADLARSITAHGLVQPILVRPIAGTGKSAPRFEIIAGERRWRAAQKAGLHEVPVIIREVGDRQALELAIIENVQRADLNAVEEALAYQQLMNGHGYSQADLGQVISKSRSHVANTLRLLKLPRTVLDYVTQGLISAGHARTLVTAGDPEGLAKRILREGLSVRQAEALAQKQATGAGESETSRRAPETKSADHLALEKRLGDATGLKVAVRIDSKGAGELRIHYRSVEQLDDICRRLEEGA